MAEWEKAPTANEWEKAPRTDKRTVATSGPASRNITEDILRGVARGATGNLSDEAAAAMEWLAARGVILPGMEASVASRERAGMPVSRSYGENLEFHRGRYRGANPYVKMGSEAAGSVLTGGVGVYGAMSRAPSVIMKMLAGAGAGAAAGGVHGYGAGEGGVGNRLTGAAEGAALGAPIGAVIPGVGAAARGVVRKFAGTGMSRAEQKLLQNLRRDQVPPSQFGPRLNRLGPEGMPVDAGGQNVRQMGAAVANIPGRGRNIAHSRLTVRDQGEARRVHEGISSIVGKGDYNETFEALAKAQRQAADKALEPILEHGPVKSTTLQQLMKRSDLAQEVIARVRKDVSMAGVDETDIRFVHEVYKEVNAMLRTAKRAGDGGAASRLNKLKDAMRPALTKEVKGYGDYLKRYASDATLKDAMEDGTKALRADPYFVRKFMAKASPEAKAAYRIGAAKALHDMMDNTPVTAAGFKRIFSRPVMRKRIRALFPEGPAGSKEYHAFRKTILREAEFRQSHEAANVGSRTTPLKESIEDYRKFPWAEVALESAMDLNPGVTIAKGAGRAAKAQGRKLSPKKALKDAEVLFANTPEAKEKLVQRLLQNADDEMLNSIVATLVGGSAPTLPKAGKELRVRIPRSVSAIPY